MTNARPRKRDASGRYVPDVQIDLGAVHRDYDDPTLTTNEVCIRNSLSASSLHRLVRQHHWTPRRRTASTQTTSCSARWR